ncbi:Hpt domain-containing protein [Rhodobacter sp. HX-7-19]|uniref:Hpt domain-containing protein n=1 Tax=Paragemmobacter kunshanensis TaxID=2583234 RepID=A0A6M1U9C9_9RHOB|nr:Hpt domain-containing protein [Rhodobacter kunshanensis]NGQ90991.1 Hpt domain-containing protein [Rhodobacter kunshanensis]
MTFQADLPQPADMAARLAPIRAHFIGTLPPRRDRLTTFLDSFETPDVEPAIMRQLQEDAHKMRGVAPTLGFTSLGQAAALVDELLEPWHSSNDGVPVTDRIIDGLALLLAEIEETIAAR